MKASTLLGKLLTIMSEEGDLDIVTGYVEDGMFRRYDDTLVMDIKKDTRPI